MKYKPLILVILDGLGVSFEKQGNPAAVAATPTLRELERNFPFTSIQASGSAVGLPWGEAGNSEVGHLTMGAGRVIYHHLPRIINAISDGSFFINPAFLRAAEHLRASGGRMHIAGLVSSGSVHSYLDHLGALLEFAKRQEIAPVYLHVFTDGKDAPPKGGEKFLRVFQERAGREFPAARIATLVGRFYAMDRDEKWDRTRRAYELLTTGAGRAIASVPEYLASSYDAGGSDEFIEPAVADPDGIIREHDALIFFNFREDSMRQITHAFVDDEFDKFPRAKVQDLEVVTMTEYEGDLSALAAFPALDIRWPLARVLADAGLRHLHIAETEKYAHVTYFFNGGVEKPFVGEDRILVPSQTTAHFDQTPEMRSPEITARILDDFSVYDVVIANFANADMVGHSGNFSAAVAAVEALDIALGKLTEAVLGGGGVMLVTADHGNVERKQDLLSGEKMTQHSVNPVPFFLVGQKFRRETPRTDQEIARQKSDIGGILTDVAPTILALLEIEKPLEMTGLNLLPFLSQQS
ncbi:MAG: 2,3-bisphosphoglycerate-independent phosphoglycerate mutase [Candidatus Sungbacteria bacterium]|uniref:2,3-bisphosphoglycerate-independent phosphoglycerate mutase n=1 Tax=Candidatus Sungiibacteriota bacterium TaxID=2750080 RepID=A0A932VPM0_9BACT|nr:2,3-bisphosphoglycerate-independent phosphoglycerate mutase [Candidatus Sungbacteria bacterium]